MFRGREMRYVESGRNLLDRVIKETPVIKVTKEKQDLRKKEPPLIDLKVTNPSIRVLNCYILWI